MERRPFITFPSKKDEAISRSELVFLDRSGLAVCVTAIQSDHQQGRVNGQPVELVSHDPVSRLTLVRVLEEESRRPPVSEFGNSLRLSEGDELYLGLEGDIEKSRLVSRESSYNGMPLPLQLLRIHHPQGESPMMGTPLFDAAGRLLAICYRKAPEFGNGTFAFPVEVISRIRNGTTVSGQLQRSWFGVELLSSNPAAIVQGVRQDSPAAKAGIQQGDILLAIGDRKVSNYYEAVDAFYYLLEGERTSVKLLRGIELLELQVMPELVSPPVQSPEQKPAAVK